MVRSFEWLDLILADKQNFNLNTIQIGTYILYKIHVYTSHDINKCVVQSLKIKIHL